LPTGKIVQEIKN